MNVTALGETLFCGAIRLNIHADEDVAYVAVGTECWEMNFFGEKESASTSSKMLDSWEFLKK